MLVGKEKLESDPECFSEFDKNGMPRSYCRLLADDADLCYPVFKVRCRGEGQDARFRVDPIYFIRKQYCSREISNITFQLKNIVYAPVHERRYRATFTRRGLKIGVSRGS